MYKIWYLISYEYWPHWLAETHSELGPLKYFRLDAVEDKLLARACWMELVTESKDSKLFALLNAADDGSYLESEITIQVTI